MSLLDGRDAQPTLQVSPGALLSDQPRSKESKIGKRKSGGLSKKGKHARNNRTPPDSPRGDRIARGGKNQPSPTVKSHRKRYSHLGLDLSGAESDEEEEEEDEQTYFANQAASEATERTETFFTIETEGVAHPPTSPGERASSTTVISPNVIVQDPKPQCSSQCSLRRPACSHWRHWSPSILCSLLLTEL
jgi:hypothetical protein